MKKLLTPSIIGLLGGFLGALIFQPITGIFSLIFSDFTLGGLALGALSGFLNFAELPTLKKFAFFTLIGVIIFAILGLISGKLFDDIIAGVVIGLLIATISHFLGNKIQSLFNNF